jgi:hypothetical protein
VKLRHATDTERTVNIPYSAWPEGTPVQSAEQYMLTNRRYGLNGEHFFTQSVGLFPHPSFFSFKAPNSMVTPFHEVLFLYGLTICEKLFPSTGVQCNTKSARLFHRFN